MIKTATGVPDLQVNSGLVKARVTSGDANFDLSPPTYKANGLEQLKTEVFVPPKDVWAVRLAISNCLIDGKYFKPLELSEL
ncbi:hypothetical protein MLD38_011724 [Melastoma candidum]|uniref:Uncharacterized protein n=1 Tax=Melastoma candidum TaxID=119954 RepID=A0ACB9R5Q4_9MYRT|nr:hypothetical protein MLD38_011724 [Melastoma candidum]